MLLVGQQEVYPFVN